MIQAFREQKKLHIIYVYKIFLQMLDTLAKDKNIIEFTVPKDKKLTVCGDVHGQFYDFLHIFELNGFPSEENPYIFNGDFVDRGNYSSEIILTLFAFRILYPNSVYLNRYFFVVVLNKFLEEIMKPFL